MLNAVLNDERRAAARTLNVVAWCRCLLGVAVEECVAGAAECLRGCCGCLPMLQDMAAYTVKKGYRFSRHHSPAEMSQTKLSLARNN